MAQTCRKPNEELTLIPVKPTLAKGYDCVKNSPAAKIKMFDGVKATLATLLQAYAID